MLDRMALAAIERAERWAAAVRARQYARNALVDPTSVLCADARIYNLRSRGDIRVGANSTIHAELLTFRHGGRIEIGSGVFVGSGSRVWSASSVWIGDRVRISHEVEIHDSNSHSLDVMHRREHFKHITNGGHPERVEDIATAPIRLNEGVIVGFRTTILKGVTIGAGTMIGPGSLVATDLPPHSLASGWPAKVLSRL